MHSFHNLLRRITWSKPSKTPQHTRNLQTWSLSEWVSLLAFTYCTLTVIMASNLCASSQRSHWPASDSRSREGCPWREGGGPLPHLLPVADRAAHEDRLQQRHRASSCRSRHSKSNHKPSSLDSAVSPTDVWTSCVPLSFQISSTMSWSLYELSRHPEVQASLQAEVLSVLGGRSIPVAADVARMPLLKATVKEVLRYNSKGFS